MQNSNIFANIFISNNINQIPTQNGSNKDSELIQINEDRYKMKLTLRKKKLEENLAKGRNMYLINNLDNDEFNFEKYIILKEPFTNLISEIELDYKDETKLIILLQKIKFIFQEKLRNKKVNLIENIYQFTAEDLYNNNWIEKFYKLILIYLKNSEIIELIIHILFLSSEFIKFFSKNDNLLIDNNEHLNKGGYFISSDKYIDVYNKILDLYIQEKNQKIIYFMVFFIANIADKEKSNQENLFSSGTFNYLMNSIDIENDDIKDIDAKIWCLGKFDLEEKYNINLDVSLKLQKIYIELFLNQEKFNLFDGINEAMDENNIFYNFLKLIDNTCFCIQVAYFETLLKSNILEFLMDNVNKENPKMIDIILDMFINLTTAETSLLNRLIGIGVVKFLFDIIADKTLHNYIRNKALVPINNLLSEPQLWNKVLFDNKILKLFCILLKDKNIDESNFAEICYGIRSVLPFCNEEYLKTIVDDYFIVQLITIAMKNILERNKGINPQPYSIYVNLMLKLFTVDYNNIKEIIIYKFQSVNGLEVIDQIINKFIEIDSTYLTDEMKKDFQSLLNLTQVIKDWMNKV